MASSIASLVPDPIEKCAVCAASPSSTTLPRCQRPQRTVGNCRQTERLASSRCPARWGSNSSFAERHRLGLGGAVEAGASPGRLRALDDPGAAVSGERIGVHLEEPVLGLFEDEGERRQGEIGAEPGEAVRTQVDRRLEVGGEAFAHQAVHSVAADDQVGRRQLLRGRDLAPETDRATERLGPLTQDGEELGARDGGKAVAGRDHRLAAVAGLDLLPGAKAAADASGGRWVGLLEERQRLVGKDHAEAESVVRPVALEDFDSRLPERPASSGSRSRAPPVRHRSPKCAFRHSTRPLCAHVGRPRRSPPARVV